jgi:hypothetical protein
MSLSDLVSPNNPNILKRRKNGYSNHRRGGVRIVIDWRIIEFPDANNGVFVGAGTVLGLYYWVC